jgi:hypothetical protein
MLCLLLVIISELIDIAVSSTCQLALPFDSCECMGNVIQVFMCCLKDKPVWPICQILLTTCFWGGTGGSSVIALSSSTALSEVLLVPLIKCKAVSLSKPCPV